MVIYFNFISTVFYPIALNNFIYKFNFYVSLCFERWCIHTVIIIIIMIIIAH